ncbi:MAG: hypothetical protein HC884_06255 [Chloroflexaceae bacterium]|nr:hypothetical protein [Chloroflexaceae bacterium]
MDRKRYALNRNQPRPWWLFLAWVWLALVPLLANGCETEQPRVYRVGILSGLDYFVEVTDGFKAGMAELGYLEGQHIIYDVCRTNFDEETYRQALQQFVADGVDLIVAFPTEAALEAKAATAGTGIPVIFALAFTEGVDLIESVPEPGGNITGVRYPGPDIVLKRFEIMHELQPQTRRIWVPYQRNYLTVANQLAVLSPVVEAAGITLIEIPAANAAELEANLTAQATTVEPGMDAILFLGEPLTVTADTFAVIARFAAQHRIPIGGHSIFMSADHYGAVFGVDVNGFAAGHRLASLADKIFHDTPAGTIRVLSAESQLQINYHVAEELGLTVPEGLLKEADEVVR